MVFFLNQPLIAPLVFIILSRLLTPDGVMTSALMVIGFSQIFGKLEWESFDSKRTEVLASSNVAFG